ncbi:MAG TPA: hypothetical protein VHG91_05570 [Longimicrobium sp.]|nr:hypothetical protein [Longimicrobium sp.]
MKRLVLLLAAPLAAPSALAAQHDPAADTFPRVQPPMLAPYTGDRGTETLAGAAEGALAGAVYGAVLTQTHPQCILERTAAGGALSGAVHGAVVGGIRGFLGKRRPPMPTRTAARLPHPAVRGAGGPHPDRVPSGEPEIPIADRECLAGRTDPSESR